jgi:tRNA dimethylallyltransferase
LSVLLIIYGPTAVGKTEVAIRVAQHFGTEIISADSRQVYRELVIGTAKPDPEQLALVHHHLVGHRSIHEPYNVSIFEQEFLKRSEVLFTNHPILVMTGGSGMYIDVATKGIDDLPDIDPVLRNQLKEAFEKRGLEWLQGEVRQIDPCFWGEADQKNPARLLRALEVFQTTGIPFSSLRKGVIRPRSFHVIKTGLTLPREALNKRIDIRVDRMMAQGLEKECRELFLFRHLKALQTVGYQEMFQYLEGNISLEQAVTDIKTHTRRYAKRQMTWLRRETGIRWFSPDKEEELIQYIEDQIHTDKEKNDCRDR